MADVTSPAPSPSRGPRRGALSRIGGGRGRFLLLVTGLTVAGMTVAVTGVPDPEPWLTGWGRRGATETILATLSVAGAILIMIPRTVVAVTAGALFGWVPAAVYILVGALLGASVAFVAGRLLGREYTAAKLRSWSEHDDRGGSRSVSGWLKRQLTTVDAWLERDGVMGIWIIRMVPVTHYGVTSYAAGTAAIRYRHFLLGTLLATIPGAVGFTAVGGAVVDHRNLPLAGAVATAVGVFGVVAAWFIRRRIGRRNGDRVHNVETAPSARKG